MEFKGKKENKIIKCFWDIKGTIDELGNDKTQTERFFENLKMMEKTFSAKTDVVFMTMYDNIKAKKYFEKMISQFDKHDMKDRISSCQYDGGFINSSGSAGYSEYFENKAKMIENYEATQEKNKKDIVFCFYAGDCYADLVMANSHEMGEVYIDTPGVFIDAKNFRNSFSFQNKKKRSIETHKDSKELVNYKALSKGFESIVNNVAIKNTKHENSKTSD